MPFIENNTVVIKIYTFFKRKEALSVDARKFEFGNHPLLKTYIS